MTAKEAAKRSWETVSARSAAIFVVGGVAAIAAGKFIEGADGATLYGYLVGGWGVLQSLIERSAKRTGSEVTSQVFERLGEHAAKIERGDKEHGECMGLHQSHGEAIVKLRADVDGLTGEAVKQGWKLNAGT